MKKILVFGVTDNPGGVESVIMNYYRNIDRSKVQFDFLCNTQKVAYEEEIKLLGGKIFRVAARSKDFKKYKSDMKFFFSKHSNEYDAIWVNLCSLTNIDYLIYAKKYNIKRRIIHCHNSSNMNGFLSGIIHKINRLILKRYATDYWTCSLKASNWFYKYVNTKEIKLINNAIDCEKYKYDDKVRKKYRKELSIENNYVVGNIGRLHFQKNQLFFLDVIFELKKKIKNIKGIIVGEGPDRGKIESKINELGLNNDIILTGIRNDVEKIIQVFDSYLFPSLFEGLPIVLLEAESNGLPIYASNTISEEAFIAKNINVLPLTLSAEEWAKCIYMKYKKDKRVNNLPIISKKGFNIKIEAKKLENFFTTL